MLYIHFKTGTISEHNLVIPKILPFSPIFPLSNKVKKRLALASHLLMRSRECYETTRNTCTTPVVVFTKKIVTNSLKLILKKKEKCNAAYCLRLFMPVV